MPIDINLVTGAKLTPQEFGWQPHDILLYHLGLGAGNPPTDATELKYTYESHLKVLPTYGVIPMMPMIEQLLNLPGMDVHLSSLLHGEHRIEIHQPLPTAATVNTSGEVLDVVDKGRAVVLTFRTETRDLGGKLLLTNTVSAYFRGERTVGDHTNPENPVPAQPAPAQPAWPDRDPDHVLLQPTMPQQALLYRLSGDMNPMHADPMFAKIGGFDQPILHGLCTYGVVCRAIVDALLGGAVDAVGTYSARFAGVMYPGETLEINVWERDTEYLVRAYSRERAAPVLSNAVIGIRR